MHDGKWAAAVALAAGVLLAGCGSTIQTRTAGAGPAQDALSATPPGGADSGVRATTGDGNAVPARGVSPIGGSTRAGSAPVPSRLGQPPVGFVEPPATGPGWDRTSVYVGVPTEEDLSRALAAAAISFNPGSIQADVTAIVADLNARGGLFGRKLVAVFHDNAAAEVSSNPEAAAQENCAAFTQDRRVVAVLNPIAPIESESFLQCMKRARTPLLSIGYSTYDDEVYRKYGPYLFTTLTPNVDRFVPAYVPALKEAGFFGGWDTSTGRAAGTPAVVGLLEPDTAIGRKLAALHATALGKAGVKLGMTYFYREDASTYSADMSSAVLQFRNAGITHVLDITNVAAGVLVFAQTAQQQRFFPRYGMTSWLLPDTAAQVFAQSGIAQQLNGAIGIGWTPGGDVNQAHDPGETAPQKACREALARQGVTYRAQHERYAMMVGWALCDDLNLLVAAAKSGGGLSPEALVNGMARLNFRPAVTFSSALSATNHSVPGSYRALRYDGACQCFVYTGRVRPLA